MFRLTLLSLSLLMAPHEALAEDHVTDNEKLMMRFYNEVVNEGHFDLIDELVAEGFVEHETFPGLSPDREGLRQFLETMRTAFPDLRFEVDLLLSDEDMVVAYITMSGTQKEEFLGVPPQGQSFATKTIDIVRFAEGKAVEHWGVTDTATMMEQLMAEPTSP